MKRRETSQHQLCLADNLSIATLSKYLVFLFCLETYITCLLIRTFDVFSIRQSSGTASFSKNAIISLGAPIHPPPPSPYLSADAMAFRLLCSSI